MPSAWLRDDELEWSFRSPLVPAPRRRSARPAKPRGGVASAVLFVAALAAGLLLAGGHAAHRSTLRGGVLEAAAATVNPARMLHRIAECESHGNPHAVSPDGRYRGKYQFDRGTWAALGGRGDPARASGPQQDRLARRLMARRGRQPWPVCGSS
jgi:hypothetical protein